MKTFSEFVLFTRQFARKEFRTGDIKLAQKFINKFFKINPPLDIVILDGVSFKESNLVPESEIWLVDVHEKVKAIFKIKFV